MTIENAVRAYIIAQIPGTTVVRTSADPALALPFVLLTTDDDEETRTTGVTLNSKQLELTVDCWAATPTAAAALADQIKSVFRDYVGSFGGYQIMFSRFFNSFDSRDGEAAQFARSFTLLLTYQEV
jgi:hypothetical protein